MRRIALHSAAIGAVVFAAAGAAPAFAAAPMPCRGVSFTDKDDADANRNIRAGWFSISEGRLTANLRLGRVDQELAPARGSRSSRCTTARATRTGPAASRTTRGPGRTGRAGRSSTATTVTTASRR